MGEHEVGRMGWPVQDRQRGQRPQGCEVLCRRGEGLGRLRPGSRRPPGIPEVPALTSLRQDYGGGKKSRQVLRLKLFNKKTSSYLNPHELQVIVINGSNKLVRKKMPK